MDSLSTWFSVWIFFILNFTITNTVISKKSYFRLNIWWDVIYVQRSKKSSFIRITLWPNSNNNNYNDNIINNLYIIILKVFTWMATEVFKPEDSQNIRKCTAESSRTQETLAIRFWLRSIWFSGELMTSFIDNYVYIKNHNNIEHKHKLCLIRYAELEVVNAKKLNACQVYLERVFFPWNVCSEAIPSFRCSIALNAF